MNKQINKGKKKKLRQNLFEDEKILKALIAKENNTILSITLKLRIRW